MFIQHLSTTFHTTLRPALKAKQGDASSFQAVKTPPESLHWDSSGYLEYKDKKPISFLLGRFVTKT